jgi:hypothetical protein
LGDVTRGRCRIGRQHPRRDGAASSNDGSSPDSARHGTPVPAFRIRRYRSRRRWLPLVRLRGGTGRMAAAIGRF